MHAYLGVGRVEVKHRGVVADCIDGPPHGQIQNATHVEVLIRVWRIVCHDDDNDVDNNTNNNVVDDE
jgi:hypothetical protein